MLLFLLFMFKYGFVLTKSVTDPPALFKGLVKYKEARSTSDFVFWPNGTIPFYINESHFDSEQTSQILRALHEFKTVTCLKFVPLVAPPAPSHVVMLFQNPHGEKLCNIREIGHPRDQPQTVDLGYKCLESPHLEMIIMRALGFPFEHNRMMRDIFIQVQKENVLQEYLGLFDKEAPLPPDLSVLPYDTSSVLHFDEFEYTKNGHRTIIIRDKVSIPHQKTTLSRLDKRKIQIVYGPECRKRERADKLEICKVYAPSVSRRRKRSLDASNSSNDTKQQEFSNGIKNETTITNVIAAKESKKKSKTENSKAENTTLNDVKPQIVARASKANESKNESIDGFNIKNNPNEAKFIVDNVEDLLEQALIEAKQKHCNSSEPYKKLNQTQHKADFSNNTILAMDVLDYISAKIQEAIKEQLSNLTEFCGYSDMKAAIRTHCINLNDPRCKRNWYRSTHFNGGRYTTRIRPAHHVYSTKHPRDENRFVKTRRKRDINTEMNTENPSQHQVTWTKVVTIDNRTEDIKKNSKKWEYNINRRDIDEKSYVEPFKVDSSEHETPVSRFKVKKSVHKLDLNNNQDKTQFNKERNRFKVSKNKHNASKKQESDNFSSEKIPQMHNADSTLDSDSKERIEVKKTSHKRHKVQDNDDRQGIETLQRKPPKKQNNKEYTDETIQKNYESIENVNLKIDVTNKKINKNNDGSNEKQKLKKHANKKEKLVENKVVIPDINDLPEIITLPKENFEFYNERKWPSGIVPYFIQETTKYDIETLRANLKEVNDILKEKTCVQLKEIGEGDFKKYKDYLVLDSKQRDYVTGKVGGRQIFGSVELFQGGQHRQFTAMMVMAMLGFYFEVARIDRDKYIRVHTRHVRPDKLHHFEKIREGATMPLPYDYASATHPAWQFWRKIGKTGISTVATYKNMDPDGKLMRRLGQNTKLFSDIDILKINTVYGLKCNEKKMHNSDSDED